VGFQVAKTRTRAARKRINIFSMLYRAIVVTASMAAIVANAFIDCVP
jgi:hypothetical protein